MSTATSSFYVTGGTLRSDAPSYVERRADRDLYEGLSRGEFCYMLHARQMGKSSLMVRTAARLRSEGVAVAVLDLTAIGQNLSPEQWYDGLRDLLGQQLDLEDELDDFWQEQMRLGPLQRWMKALREVVLARVPGRIVLFLDEIDAVRSLPFSTDELFAGIRECYNRRTEGSAFGRLTFCLLGVASPSDLIRDTRTTPFNIGRRIELTDFTPTEAAPLAAGLRRKEPEGTTLLQRALYWTGGHPYLTQRLCRAVAEDQRVTDATGVDRLCEELFLSPRARERDDNLLFVRERLLRSEADLANLLDLYGQVRRGKPVRDDETNSLVSLLRLSGITRTADGHLRVRNRIYARVFDRQWVVAHMPDAERRRQRAAFRRGLTRASAVAGVIVTAMGVLAVTAVNEAQLARQQRRVADQQRQVAEVQRTEARRNLYAAQMNLAQQRWDEGNVGRALELLEAWRPASGQEDLRGFEWRYLWRLCQGDARFTLWRHPNSVNGVAFSPDGKLLASASEDTTVKLWDLPSRREVATLRGHEDEVRSVAFSPDGKTLASSGDDETVKLWDMASRRLVSTLKGHRGQVVPLAFSRDGRLLASGSTDRTVKLWDLASRREVTSVKGYAAGWHGNLALSPDGRTLAMGRDDFRVRLWDLASQREVASLKGHTHFVQGVAFSPDGRMLASGGYDNTVRFWAGGPHWGARSATKRLIATLQGRSPLAFSPNGKTLASSSGDNTIKLWDVATKEELAAFKGHKGEVMCLAFSPDGSTLASAGEDHTIKLWDPAARGTAATFIRQSTAAEVVAFSADGRVLATANQDATVRLWDVASGRVLATLKGHKAWVGSLAFSPDGKFLASGSRDRTVKVWEVASRRPVASLPGFTSGRPGFMSGRWGLDFSPNSQTLAWQSDDAVKLWNVPTQRIVATFPWRPRFSGVAFCPDGKSLAVLSGGAVTLWDLAARRAAATFSAAPPLKFAPDGKTLVTSNVDGTLQLWDIPTKRLLAPIKGQTPWGEGNFAISPDSKTLAAKSANGVILWNLPTRQELAALKGHTGGVSSVAFSPDGNTLATAAWDGTVRLWRAAPFAETDAPSGARLSPPSR